VAALLQLPLVELLNDAANSGAAAHSTRRNTPNRAMDLVMEPLSSRTRKWTLRRAPFRGAVSYVLTGACGLYRSHTK
jgi:hypothetical protein